MKNKDIKIDSKIIKLDIGCGPHKKDGYLGIDILPQPGVDIVVDLNKEPLPFPDNSIEEIYTSHFMEHANDVIKVIKEFDRVLKHNGILKIIVPHYTNPYAYHFTHKTFWSSYSFEQQYLDYYINTNLVLISKKIKIINIKPLDKFFELLVNRSLSLYERFFSSFVKAWEIEFVLKKDDNKNYSVVLK